MALSGAWSISGRPLEAILTARETQALGGAAALDLGPLRLLADPARTARVASGCAAFHGILAVADSSEALRGWLSRSGEGPPLFEGHYAALKMDAQRRRLALWRDPTGDVRLYYARRGEVLFFSTSLRTLLSCGWSLELEAQAVAQRALNELPAFGNGTPLRGVEEVLAGYELRASPDGIFHRWAWSSLLEPATAPSPEAEAAQLRAGLEEAVGRSIRRGGDVAVALSGGIDSSAIAAAAAALAGPDRLHAFTYEFEDASHPSEVPYAAAVCRHLGVRRHTVVSISAQEYRRGVAPAIRASEDAVYWRRPYVSAFVRRIRDSGFTSYLTGYGFGSHLAAIQDVADLLEWLPALGLTLRHWRAPPPSAAPDRFLIELGAPSWQSRLHPGLARPFPRLLLPIAAVLAHRGRRDAVAALYPKELRPLVDRALGSQAFARSLAELDGLSLAAALTRLCFVRLNSSVDATRHATSSSAEGVWAVSPASFPSLLQLTHLPHRRVAADRTSRARPGKSALRRAMRGILPNDIIERKKYWPHPGGPMSWRTRALAEMNEGSSRAFEDLRGVLGRDFHAAQGYFPAHLAPLALWRDLFPS